MNKNKMKSSHNIILTTCIVVALLCLIAFTAKNKPTVKSGIGETDEKGFAVLELFTSEGCSSCPPADELMARIQLDSKGKAVYLLAYHVDYWDRQGWKDGFSSADFSNRQMQYGRWLHVSPVYTPQVIVNGKAEFVGSSESAIRKAISEQLATGPVANLVIHTQQDGEKLILQYQASQAAKGSRLLIAILQKAAQTKVERGENAGRTLSHVQIVRKLQNEPISPSGKGSFVITLPNGLNTQYEEVVGLIQDPASGEILAAARADLNKSLSAK